MARGHRLVWTLAAGVLAACGERERPDDDLAAIHAPEVARLVSANEALAGANIPVLDPATMNDAEIRRVLGSGPHCSFRYTAEGKPVLAVLWKESGAAADGTVKLNGDLVALTGTAAEGKLTLTAGAVQMTLTPDAPLGSPPARGDERREADLEFAVGDKLRVGYRGYYACPE